MRKYKMLLNKRMFLNPKTSYDSGTLHYWVSNDYNFDASIEIADCLRKIKLDFSCDNLKEAKQRIKKLNILINAFTEVKQEIEKHFETNSGKKKKNT